ncbi:DNRLRE domain-containing protein, partial [Modestobacter sp. KNN46-3]|uniref:DNRLRE domain-containing protein n=1 Tax=Modestobacter sp. KNN46-3 TaxID=2711218 RepID=UPI0013DF4AC2
MGSSGAPQVWDAGVDGERLHPITEPWTEEDDQPLTALAPLPDWGAEEAAEERPSEPTTAGDAQTLVDLGTPGEPPALPSGSETEVTDAPGQVDSPASADAGGSTTLVLTDAAVVTSPHSVEVALTPDTAFLADAETQYPVVVDPEYRWEWGFDTWVQTGFSSDQSGSTELRLGTYDGGATVARSFMNFDLSGIRNKTILQASLNLYEWHAWSCQARNWEVWDTAPATTAARINAQPGWFNRQSTSGQTKGGNGCDDGWVAADLTKLVQTWSSTGYTTVGVGVMAENERDSYGWKKFNSAEAGWGVPTLYVNWNTPPGPSDGLAVSNTVNKDGRWTSSVTPRLSGTVHDADGSTNALFELWRVGGQVIWSQWVNNVRDGQVAFVDVPPGVLADGGSYSFLLHTHDGLQWNTATSAWADFRVDTAAPGAPSITSTDYPSDGTWHKSEYSAGMFTATLKTSDPSLVGFEWGLDQAPGTALTPATGNVTTFSVTPTTNGVHVLQVRSVDRAGNRSSIVKYAFNVGRAGLTSPVEGSQVVRRVKLSVTGEQVFEYVKFAYRRGPDAATSQDIALADLTRANGTPLSAPWTKISDLGDYASWDVSSTLGHVPGPVQVQAIVSADADGAGAYKSAWVTVTVSPDADDAATTEIGPGSANLLTGDYTLSSTDVDEFGLALGRAASSRDPRSGFEPQQELLSAAQKTIASVSGLSSNGVTHARVTGRGHGGSEPTKSVLDSLRLVTDGSTADSFVEIAPANGQLRPGATYRADAWIYVPGSTGLAPVSPRGLRVVGFYLDANNVYREVRSNAPVKTDTWQQLSVDMEVPADAKGAPFFRLYSGFGTSGVEVFYDDVSVREIWAPLGPQWSLGTADA